MASPHGEAPNTTKLSEYVTTTTPNTIPGTRIVRLRSGNTPEKDISPFLSIRVSDEEASALEFVGLVVFVEGSSWLYTPGATKLGKKTETESYTIVANSKLVVEFLDAYRAKTKTDA